MSACIIWTHMNSGADQSNKHFTHMPSFKRGVAREEEILNKLWATKGARYKAARRLEYRAHLSNMTIAIFTLYLIILAFVPLYFIDLSHSVKNFCSFLSTAGSIGILVFSLIESGREFKVRAYKYHECARKITQVYEKMRVYAPNDVITEDALKDFSEQYQQILNSHENHENVDYSSFKLENHKHFGLNKLERFSTRVNYFFNQSALYYALIISPVLIFLFVFIFRIKI
jgi:SMODS and SLOG-associating 2TM effector domain family 5